MTPGTRFYLEATLKLLFLAGNLSPEQSPIQRNIEMVASAIERLLK